MGAAVALYIAEAQFLIAGVLFCLVVCQVRGHLLAKLDPLGLLPPRPDHEDLRLETYGFSEADLDREVDVSAVGETLNMKGFLDRERGKVTLRKIYQVTHTHTQASLIDGNCCHACDVLAHIAAPFCFVLFSLCVFVLSV